MSAASVLADLRAAGIVVRVADGKLRLSPRSAVTEALAERVRAHKPELLAMLTRPDPGELWRKVVEEVSAAQGWPADVKAAALAAKAQWR